MASGFTSTRARIKLRRILTASENNVKVEMKKAADTLRDEMQARVPVKSGTLKNNITSAVAKNGLRAEAGIRGKKAKKAAFYAPWIEFGTKGHGIKPETRKALAFEGVFAMGADHPGIPARPFIGPAWDAKKPEIIKAVTKAIDSAVKKVSEQ